MNAPDSSDESTAFRAELEAERDRCIRLTRMGIGMPVAGFVYWLVFAWLVSRFRIDSAVYMAFLATGAVFPLGMYTVCTFQLSKAIGYEPLLLIPRFFIFIALAAWLAVFVGLIHSFVRTKPRPATPSMNNLE